MAPSRRTLRQPIDLAALGFWFFYILILTTTIILSRSSNSPTHLVPINDLSAYQVITESDLTEKPLNGNPSSIASLTNELVSHYSRQPLKAGKPIPLEQIVSIPDPALINGTVAISIPADENLLLGGTVKPGDVVQVAAIPTNKLSTSTILFERLLVLDVLLGKQPVLVLAIPVDQWLEFAGIMENNKLALARWTER